LDSEKHEHLRLPNCAAARTDDRRTLRLGRRAGSTLIPNLASAAAASMVASSVHFFLSEPAVVAKISRAICEPTKNSPKDGK
jgi:hypothetical protein